MAEELEYRRTPCDGCPWRADVDLTAFSDEDFAKLHQANGTISAEAGLDAPMMACHRDQPGTRHPMRLCAGWLATVGRDHLGVRMKILSERLPADVLDPQDDWPDLHASLADMEQLRSRGSVAFSDRMIGYGV